MSAKPLRLSISPSERGIEAEAEVVILSQLAGLSKATFQVDEEEDMGEGGGQPGPFTFHMEVHSCTQTQDRFLQVISFDSILNLHDYHKLQPLPKWAPSPATCAPTRRAGRLEL